MLSRSSFAFSIMLVGLVIVLKKVGNLAVRYCAAVRSAAGTKRRTTSGRMQLVISSSCRAACLAPSAVTAAMRNRCEGQRHDRSPCILLPPSPPLYFAAMHAPSSPALSHHQFVLGGAQCVCSRRFASTSANEKETFGVNSAFQGGSSSTTSSTSAAGSQDKRSQRAVADANFNTNCPFATLGLSREATKDEVREQYLQLSMIHHPDKGGQSWKFKRVNSAYKQSLEMIETGYAHKTASEKAAKSAAGGYSGSSESTKTAGDSASSSSSSSSQHQQPQQPQKPNHLPPVPPKTPTRT